MINNQDIKILYFCKRNSHSLLNNCKDEKSIKNRNNGWYRAWVNLYESRHNQRESIKLIYGYISSHIIL